MYYPKSQIKENQYTNGGEFKSSTTGKDYKGFYFITSNQEYYSGRNPDNPPNILLIKSNPDFAVIDESSVVKPTEWATEYLFLKRKTNTAVPTPPTLPTSTFPNPTEEDYKLGEIQRYFLKKTNELKFIEVSKEDFRLYRDKSSNVSYQFYRPIQIPWVISGDRTKVYKTNEKTVSRTNIKGFTQYFRKRFDQFYK